MPDPPRFWELDSVNAWGLLIAIVSIVLTFVGPESVKRDETSSHSDWMTDSRDGSLIQATLGSLGGTGRRWRKREGLAT